MKHKNKFLLLSALLAAVCGIGAAACKGHTHEYGSWETVKEPTCTEDGLRARRCTGCDEEETEKIESPGHSFGEWTETEPPTCTAEGKSERTCTVCGETETNTLPKTEHTDGGWEFDDSGHWKNCAVCGETIAKKTAHTAQDGICSVCGYQEGVTDGLIYTEYDDHCVLYWMGDVTETEIVIPAYHNGKPVTEIGPSAFHDSKIVSIHIPDTVTAIGSTAFNWCQKLETVTGMKNVETIGEMAFCRTNVSQIPLGERLVSVGASAFESSGLKELQIPDSVTDLGESCFSGCRSLLSVEIGKGVRELPHLCFYQCAKLGSVTFSEGLESTGKCTFDLCPITALEFPSTLKTIGEESFTRTALERLVVPDSVTKIEARAFEECESLLSADLGNGLVSLGQDAFRRCYGCMTVKIGRALSEIGAGAFDMMYGSGMFGNQESLENIAVDGANQHFYSRDGILYERATNKIRKIPFKIAGNVAVADGVTQIVKEAPMTDGHNAVVADTFENRALVTEITLPASVAVFGFHAFYGCSALTKITFLGSSVQWKEIQKDSTWRSPTLTSVTCNDITLTEDDIG